MAAPYFTAMEEEGPVTLDGAIRRILSEGGAGPGSVQIICLPVGHFTERIGTYFAHLLSLLLDGARVFERLRLLVPPGTEPGETSRAVAEAVDATFVRAGHEPRDEAGITRIQKRVDIVVCDDLSSDTARRLATAEPENTVVAIARAAHYRVPDLVNQVSEGEAAMLGSDETWLPHLQRLADDLAKHASATKKFFLLDTGLFKPRAELLDQLYATPDCSILTAALDDPEAEIDVRMPQWRAWIAKGLIGRVLQDLDAIEGLAGEGKRVVRIQLLDAAGLRPQALEEIRELELQMQLPPAVAAKFARIAAEAGASALALGILTPVAATLSSREDLQNGLRAADRAGDPILAAKIEDALARQFPESSELRTYRYHEAVKAGAHRRAADLLAGLPGSEDAVTFHRKLAEAFDVGGVPDYDALIDGVSGDPALVAQYVTASAADALRRGLVVHAFELSTDPRVAHQDVGSGTLSTTIEQLLINRPSGVMAVPLERIVDGFAILAQRSADQPENASKRALLMDLLEPGVAGEVGLAIVLTLLLRSASRPVNPERAPILPDATPLGEIIRQGPFKDAIGRWVAREAPIMIGRTQFPLDELPTDPDTMCASILAYLGDAAEDGAVAEDLDTMNIVLALGAAIAPHSREPDIDLKMIRTAAMGLAIGGARQPARDLAELLVARADTPRRRRLAWFGLADVYNRCGDRVLAPLYGTLGLHADVAVDDDQLWHETLLINRILRDNGLTDQAADVLDAASELLRRMGKAERYEHRVQTMRIMTRMTRFRESDDPAVTIRGLLAEAVSNARLVLDRGDTAGPAAAMLAQLNRFARELGLQIDPEAMRLEAELRARLGGNLARNVEIYGRDVPTRDDLLELLAATSVARYSEDVGKDALPATMAARRALDADETLDDPQTACLAVEICCDRAIAAAGWDGAKVPPAAPTSAEALAEISLATASAGVRVVQAAFARDETLVTVIAEVGTMRSRREPDANIVLSRLQSWKERYPFAYGTAELDANRFYTSTENLRLDAVAGGATLIVADKHLRSMPPNLFRIGDAFAGELQPMAMAPSLSWLAAVRTAGAVGNGRRLAWISQAESTGTTLATLGDRMETTFAAHSFELRREPVLPQDFGGASMAVIAAHGGLNQEGSAFQVVSDEGRLVISANEFAGALHNVGIVLLFVCSGGRSDAHPAADATVGLARDLLDQGAQAVIASPWPMESIVAPPWLESFLAHWQAGKMLGEAVFAANQTMLQRWPHDYAKGLAMNLFGNPLLRV
jgi:hypothetical protein